MKPLDPETTWENLTEDIPALKKYCESIIGESDAPTF